MSGFLEASKEEPEWDEDTFRFELPPTGRLILNTIHGEIIIDSRENDINAFVFDGRNPTMAWVNPSNYACTNRRDIQLLKKAP